MPCILQQVFGVHHLSLTSRTLIRHVSVVLVTMFDICFPLKVYLQVAKGLNNVWVTDPLGLERRKSLQTDHFSVVQHRRKEAVTLLIGVEEVSAVQHCMYGSSTTRAQHGDGPCAVARSYSTVTETAVLVF